MSAFRVLSCLLVAVVLSVCAAPAEAQNMYAQAVITGGYNYPNVKGVYQFFQNAGDSVVTINITLTGVAAGTYGTHIHTFGDINTGITQADPSISTNATGYGVGSHFNPTGAPHDCYPATPRHAGDIGNIVVTGPETQSFTLVRDLLQLGGGSSYSIIGRAVVLHSAQDQCGSQQPTGMSGTPQAQGVIGIIDPATYSLSGTNAADQRLTATTAPVSVIARLTSMSGTTVSGWVQFGWDSITNRVRVVTQITGLAPNTQHGFHVHEAGDESGTDGTNAKGHYNPFNMSHGLPPASNRHFGDMGSITSDANGNAYTDQYFDIMRIFISDSSNANIIGRSVVIHQLVDNGSQPTGAAGARYAVGVIGISNRPMPAVASRFLAQAVVRGGYNYPNVVGLYQFFAYPGDTTVVINITLTGVAAGTYGTHIHAFGDINTGNSASDPAISTNATGYGVGTHFNPTNAAHDCYPAIPRHAGDIGNLVVTGPQTQTFTLVRDLLQLGGGSNSIVGRAVVLHSAQDQCGSAQPTGMSGAPQAQGVIGVIDPPTYGLAGTNLADQELTSTNAPVSVIARLTAMSSSNVTGWVQFGWDPVTSRVRVVTQISGLAPNTQHGFHVHECGDESGTDGNNAKGHYNPANVAHGLPPALPRHMGDMGSITSDANGNANTDQSFDLLRIFVSDTSAANIIGRSVVVHQLVDNGSQPTGAAGARYAVGVIGISNRPMPPSSSTPSSGSSTGGSGGSTNVPMGTTLCDRLTTAQGLTLSSANSMTALTNFVTRAFTGMAATGSQTQILGLYGNPITGTFFNGVSQYRYAGDPSSLIVPGPSPYASPDFGNNPALLNAFVNSFVNFLGGQGLMGCSFAPGVYDGAANLGAVHQRMNITQLIFSTFNSELSATLASFGLTVSDQANLLAVLQSFGRNGVSSTSQICTQADCFCATGVTGQFCDQSTLNAAAVASIPFMSMIVAFFASFAYLLM